MSISLLLVLVFITIIIIFKFIRIFKFKKNRYALEQYIVKKAAKIFLAISILKKVSSTLDFLGVLFYIICIDPIGSYFNLIAHLEHVVSDHEVKEWIGDNDEPDEPEKKKSIFNWKKIVAIVGVVVGVWFWYKYGGGGNEPPQFTENPPISITNNQPVQSTEFVEVTSSLETAGDLLTKGSAAALTTIALSTIYDNTTQSTMEPTINMQEEVTTVVTLPVDIAGKPFKDIAEEQSLIKQSSEQQELQRISIAELYSTKIDNIGLNECLQGHNFSITGKVLEYSYDENYNVYPVFDMSDVIKEVGLVDILDNIDVCEMASAHGVFIKHPEYSWIQLEKFTKAYMLDQLIRYKPLFIQEEFVDKYNFKNTDLNYIFTHNINQELTYNLGAVQMLQIGGDSYAKFEGYNNVQELARSLQLTDTRNPKYAEILKTSEIIMSDTFITFCKHVKYAMDNKMINRPRSTEL